MTAEELIKKQCTWFIEQMAEAAYIEFDTGYSPMWPERSAHWRRRFTDCLTFLAWGVLVPAGVDRVVLLGENISSTEMKDALRTVHDKHRYDKGYGPSVLEAFLTDLIHTQIAALDL